MVVGLAAAEAGARCNGHRYRARHRADSGRVVVGSIWAPCSVRHRARWRASRPDSTTHCSTLRSSCGSPTRWTCRGRRWLPCLLGTPNATFGGRSDSQENDDRMDRRTVTTGLLAAIGFEPTSTASRCRSVSIWHTCDSSSRGPTGYVEHDRQSRWRDAGQRWPAPVPQSRPMLEEFQYSPSPSNDLGLVQRIGAAGLSRRLRWPTMPVISD